MNIKKTTASIAIFVMMVAMVFAAPASAQVEVQIGMALDNSGSIGSTNWQTIVNGVADAVNNSTCVPHDGTVELTVVSFPGGLHVGPVVITSTNATAIANSIRAIPYNGLGTPMGAGITTTANAMSGSPHFDPAIKQVINIATDGAPNSAANAITARNNAIATLQMTDGQDEIDAEGIGGNVNINWLRDNIAYPQPGNIATLGDPDSYIPGWVCVVANAQQFAESMCEKFEAIIIDDDEPCCVPVPVGPGPAGVTGVPLLTPFGAVLLIGLLAIVGAVGIRRRT